MTLVVWFGGTQHLKYHEFSYSRPVPGSGSATPALCILRCHSHLPCALLQSCFSVYAKPAPLTTTPPSFPLPGLRFLTVSQTHDLTTEYILQSLCSFSRDFSVPLNFRHFKSDCGLAFKNRVERGAPFR